MTAESRHKSGETYYWLLYYTFLSPRQLDNVNEIIEQLQPHIRDISPATYLSKVRASSGIPELYSLGLCP